MISVILVWKVSDTFKAAFGVDDYQHFVRVQTDAAVRKMAGSYPYDDWEDSDDYKITLRSGMTEVNEALEHELGRATSNSRNRSYRGKDRVLGICRGNSERNVEASASHSDNCRPRENC